MNKWWLKNCNSVAGNFRHLSASFCGRFFRSGPLCALGFACGGLLAALCLFLVALWGRLQFGPISLGPSVSIVSGALAGALPEGISVSYGRAGLEWSREDQRIHLIIQDIRMTEAGRQTIISAPKAEIDFAGPPLLRGVAEVHRITLIGVKLTLVRTAEGTLRFGIGKQRIEQDVIDQFVRKLSSARGGAALKSLAVHGAKLVFYDEPSDLYITSDKADMHLAHATGSKKLQMVVDTNLSVAGRPARLHLAAGFPLTAAQSLGTLDIKGFDVAAFLAHRKGGVVRRDSHLMTNGKVRFVLSHGALKRLKFQLNGTGAVMVPALKQQFQVKTLALRGGYDAASGKLTVDRAALRSSGASGTLEGWVLRPAELDGAKKKHAAALARTLLHAARNGKPAGAQSTEQPDVHSEAQKTAPEVSAPAPVQFGFTIRDLSLKTPQVFATPVHFATLRVRAEWDRAVRQLRFTRLHVGGTPLSAEAVGTLTFSGAGAPGLDLSGSVGMLEVHDFVKFWPLMAAPGGRSWVDAHMPAGEVGPFSFDVHFKPGELDAPVPPQVAVDVRFLMTNMEASYIDGMPHLTGIYGRGHLTGTDFTIDVDHARDGPLQLSGGQFRIPDINGETQIGDIAFTLSGAVPDLLTLLDSPPLGYPSRFGIRPNATRGQVVATSHLQVPLIHDVSVSKIKIAVHAPTSGLAIRLAPHLKVTGGTILFDVDNDGLHASGTAGLGGSKSQLQVDWTELFSAKKDQPSTQVRFQGLMDAVAMRSLDLLPAKNLSGRARAEGRLEGFHGAMADGHIALDLTPAELHFAPLNIAKVAGSALQADVTLGFAGHSVLSQLGITLSGGKASGHVVLGFDKSGALQRADLSDFRYGTDNQFSLTYLHRPDADHFDLSGGALDLSRFLDETDRAGASDGVGAKAAGPARGLILQANMQRVVLRAGTKLSDLKLDYQGRGARVKAFSLAGRLGKASVTGSLKKAADGRILQLKSGDAGTLMKGFYGFSSMRGGQLTADVKLTGAENTPSKGKVPPPDFTGRLAIKDFRIVHQPMLARLFSAGSLGGMANLMGGKGIDVDRFEAHFSARNHVVSVFDTQAVGPAIGATAEGYVDLGQDKVALKGTLVPVYGLNSMLGNIPILGKVLTSKKGEGVFGVSYEISGDTDEPSVRVNPLSMLAPGFLRRIFEGRIPKASEAPSNKLNAGKKAVSPGEKTPVVSGTKASVPAKAAAADAGKESAPALKPADKKTPARKKPLASPQAAEAEEADPAAP